MEITAITAQTVAVNNNVLFLNTPIPGSPSILHREGSGIVTLRGLTRQCRARFKVTFNGNIAIPSGSITAATPISLSIAINGESNASATMISTQTALNTYNNVSASIFIDVPCGCCSQIGIKNSSDIPISVENANLIIERVA